MQGGCIYYVYFLKSTKNQKVYCGQTTKKPEDRLKEHNQHTNKWTWENGPFVLVYYESYCCKADAIKRESFYKSGFGKKIRNAIIKSVSARG